MTLPWLPVVLVDVLGSASALILAAACVFSARRLVARRPADSFLHYLYFLTLAIAIFACSRSVGHLVKQGLLHAGLADLWRQIAPFSGAANTATFIMIFGFSLYFDRQRRLKHEIDRAGHDLAAARAARAQAEETELRLRTIFDAMEDVVYVVDREARLVFCNRRLEALLPEIEVGHLCPGAKDGYFLPASTARLDPVTIGERPLGQELHIGESLFSLVRIGLFWGDGRPVTLFVGRDTTAERHLEEQLRHAQKMEAVGTLAGGIAHDINNALTPIIGYAEIGLLKFGSDPEAAKYFSDISSSASRAAKLISGILAFSRRQVIQKTNTDLNRLLRSLMAMLQNIVEEDIELRLQLADNLPSLAVDQGQIEQVLTNCIVNARDAMPEGGLLLIESRTEPDCDTLCQGCGEVASGPHVVLSITDTGIGMDEKTLTRIFEPYFTTKPRGKGTGLGLAMSHGIVHQHGGHITFVSEPGKGTTCRIYLPVRGGDERNAPESAAAETVPVVKEQPGRDRLLLVAEDNQAVRQLVRDCLTTYGFRVEEAENGGAALERFLELGGRLDLLVTDVIMPDMDGRQLAERLRRQQADLPVLFMSGYSGEVVARKGVLEDGVEFIGKPFSPAALLEKVERALAAGTAPEDGAVP